MASSGEARLAAYRRRVQARYTPVVTTVCTPDADAACGGGRLLRRSRPPARLGRARSGRRCGTTPTLRRTSSTRSRCACTRSRSAATPPRTRRRRTRTRRTRRGATRPSARSRRSSTRSRATSRAWSRSRGTAEPRGPRVAGDRALRERRRRRPIRAVPRALARPPRLAPGPRVDVLRVRVRRPPPRVHLRRVRAKPRPRGRARETLRALLPAPGQLPAAPAFGSGGPGRAETLRHPLGRLRRIRLEGRRRPRRRVDSSDARRRVRHRPADELGGGDRSFAGRGPLFLPLERGDARGVAHHHLLLLRRVDDVRLRRRGA